MKFRNERLHGPVRCIAKLDNARSVFKEISTSFKVVIQKAAKTRVYGSSIAQFGAAQDFEKQVRDSRHGGDDYN